MADQAQPQGCSFRASVPGETIASGSGNATETESERWLPVVGFEDWYEVSDLGAVRRIRDRFGRRMDKRLRWSPSQFDYPKVSLLGQPRLVHLLVADAFRGPRAVGFEVDHGDGDRNNPRLTNLEIVTHEENVSRAAARKNPRRPRQKGWRPDELPWDRLIHGVCATALLLLALSAVGCHEPACAEKVVDITPAECKALCAPRHVYSWTINSCVCDGPIAGAEQSDGAQ